MMNAFSLTGRQLPVFESYNPGLRMVWLEITRSCNEECAHCYNDSGAHHAADEGLGWEFWRKVLADSAAAGATQVQFIGGEPTMVPWLPNAFAEARSLGFPFVEVYTNATRLSEELFRSIIENGIRVATSVYSHKPEIHDQITRLPGSWERTMSSIRRFKEVGVPIRVAVIAMPLNDGDAEATVSMIRDFGVDNVGIDRARAYGRAAALLKRKVGLKELCGHCWNGTICVDPQGDVSPCIMSRHLVVGNLRETTVLDVVGATKLPAVRKMIYDQVWEPRERQRLLEMNVCPPAFSGREEQETSGIVANTGCLPNSPYPPPQCIPYSTPPAPCPPHTCGPGTQPCWPLGGGK